MSAPVKYCAGMCREVLADKVGGGDGDVCSFIGGGNLSRGGQCPPEMTFFNDGHLACGNVDIPLRPEEKVDEFQAFPIKLHEFPIGLGLQRGAFIEKPPSCAVYSLTGVSRYGSSFFSTHSVITN